MNRHIVIPDAQVKSGVPIDHLLAAGNYITDHRPDTIICIGDFFDMHSLSIYDMGKIAGEGARYQEDIEIGKEAMELLLSPIESYNVRRVKQKLKTYRPRLIFTLGNHEYRILRHIDNNPLLSGKLGLHDLELHKHGWEVYPYLNIIEVDGVHYSHYFVNPDSAKRLPFASSVDTQLKTLGFSFIQGHRQGLFTASPRFKTDGTVIRGLIAGSFYQHDEKYQGPQGNEHWRGCLMLTEVNNGWFSPIELSIDYLLREWL